MTTLDFTGPWEAVAIDRDGYTIDPHDESDDLAEADAVAVIRRTARPVAEDDAFRMPQEHTNDDVLYVVDNLQDEPGRIRLTLSQAVAVAEAMNGRFPASPDGGAS